MLFENLIIAATFMEIAAAAITGVISEDELSELLSTCPIAVEA